MRELQTSLKGNSNWALLYWLHGGFILIATLFCVAVITLGNADADEDVSMETLALDLANAYDRNQRDAIDQFKRQFDTKLDYSLKSGELEEIVRVVRLVRPAAANWADRNDKEDPRVLGTLRELADWQSLEALASTQAKPRRMVLRRTLAKDDIPLQITITPDDREGIKQAQLYRLFNNDKHWVGETPQDVILSPGLTKLVIGFFDTVGDGKEPDKLGVDIILDGGRARIDALNYDIDSSKLTAPPAEKRPAPPRTATMQETLDYLASGAVEETRATERARLEFISSLRKRYPASSVLSAGENGLPALDVPRPPDPRREGGKGGPLSWGRTAYRKIQIESDPMGASITIDGERHGMTPQTIVMQQSEIKLIPRKPGFLETASEISMTDPVTVVRAILNPIP